MAQLTDNLRGFWNDLDGRGRAGVAGGVLLVLAIVAAFAWWTLHRDYQVLFKDMAQRDAAAVVAELKRLKVPYRLEADGSTIRVPADTVHETRLALMGRGVPLSGGVGFELFDHNDLSTTEYAQKINYQRALQGELARTIMAIEGVKLARVHLVLADASLFRRDKARPKASVSLLLQPGTSLAESQILGIQRLVAAAAPGLEPQSVTVLDQRGVTLSSAADAAPVAAAAGQLRMKKEVEDYLTRKVADVLDRTFGPGQAIVTVDVALTADEVRLTRQDVVPASGGGRDAAAGVVVHKREVLQRQPRPATVHVVDGEAPGARREDAQYNSTVETSYEVSRRVEQIVTSPGGIRRISVGIVLPRTVSAAVAAQVEELVTMAAGLELHGRGDAIAVHSLDQVLPAQAEAAPAPAQPLASMTQPKPVSTQTPFLDPWLALAAALGLLAGLAAALLVRRSRRESVLAEINHSLREARS